MSKGVRVDEFMNNFLNTCPVCGKAPKVYRDFAYEYSGFGSWCTIECKPFLRKPHVKVECGKASWERAFVGAISGWNAKTEVSHD